MWSFITAGFTRAGKNLKIFKIYLGFLVFNVRTVARGTLDTENRPTIKK